MMVIDVFLYIIFVFIIRSYETLRCYSCNEEERCSPMMNIVDGDDRNDSCMIMMNEYGLISRGLMPTWNCRSSSSQYCCYKDLCNGLPSIPLPALTNLSCMVSTCLIDDKQCSHSIIYRSSAIESCTRIRHGKSIQKSYQMGCSPRNRTISESLSCCHSPACNTQNLSADVAIRCYTCDSRINGLKGCDILNTSNIHVYRSESSSRTESCAMIVGLADVDTMTGKKYSPFTIRTFIADCVNQSLGNVTYGGARFQGRIECCSTSLCNTIPMYTNTTLHTSPKNDHSSLMNLIVFIVFVCLGVIFILIGLSISIYRYRSFHKHASSDHGCETKAQFL